MAVKRGISTDPQLVPNVTGTLYTMPTIANRAVITAVTMYANAATTGVELYIVPAGGSANTTTRQILRGFAVDETFTAPEIIGQSIETGGTIQGNDGGNGGTGVNFTLTVTEFTGDS